MDVYVATLLIHYVFVLSMYQMTIYDDSSCKIQPHSLDQHEHSLLFPLHHLIQILALAAALISRIYSSRAVIPSWRTRTSCPVNAAILKDSSL